jgi:hypothetical protein
LKPSGDPNVLLAAVDIGLSDALVNAEFDWSQTVMSPVHYLRDYWGYEDSKLSLVLARLRGSPGSVNFPPPGGPSDGCQVGQDPAGLPELVGNIDRRWGHFSDSLTDEFDSLNRSVVGLLVLSGGSAMLPLADKLLNAGFKLELENDGSSPLVTSVVDHFVRRCWVEKQLELPNTRAIHALRRTLLWLSEKTGDNFQINWQAR